MGRVLLTFQRLRRERLPSWNRKSSHRSAYVGCSFSPPSFQTGARSVPLYVVCQRPVIRR
jgi:hypothetical protein